MILALTTFPAEENSEAKSESRVLKDRLPTNTFVRPILFFSVVFFSLYYFLLPFSFVIIYSTIFY